jgi:hypothetical protein
MNSMPLIPKDQDSFGQALLDHLEGRATGTLMLEAEDNSSTPAMQPGWFFQASSEWYDWERNALDRLEGPVLDLGCGAGRAALYLQEKGLEVAAIDVSPGAVEVCSRRGLRDVRLGDLCDPPTDRHWRSILMLCGNLGLAGGWQETQDLLIKLAACSSEEAVLVGDTVDPTITDDTEEIVFQRRQVEQGCYRGHVRLRLRYGECVSPWWDQINIAISDIQSLVTGTGWSIRDHHINGIDHYVMLLKSG